MTRDSCEDEDRWRRRRGDEKRGNHNDFSGYIRRGFHRAWKGETWEGLGAHGREGGHAGQGDGKIRDGKSSPSAQIWLCEAGG